MSRISVQYPRVLAGYFKDVRREGLCERLRIYF
jgi:hypothetical protein